MKTFWGKIGMAGFLALGLAACTGGGQTNPTANVIDGMGSFSAAERVTDVSQTPVAGTVIYDEVIPFELRYSTGNGTTKVSTTGALQSRVIRSTQTGNLVFAYRFRDLVFDRTAPDQGGSYFIEFVRLTGFDTADLPISVYDLLPSQSLGGEIWSGGPNVTIGQPSNTDVAMDWQAFYTKPDGTTFVAFSTSATKFKTGNYMNVGDQALGEATLSRIAVPDP